MSEREAPSPPAKYDAVVLHVLDKGGLPVPVSLEDGIPIRGHLSTLKGSINIAETRIDTSGKFDRGASSLLPVGGAVEGVAPALRDGTVGTLSLDCGGNLRVVVAQERLTRVTVGGQADRDVFPVKHTPGALVSFYFSNPGAPGWVEFYDTKDKLAKDTPWAFRVPVDASHPAKGDWSGCGGIPFTVGMTFRIAPYSDGKLSEVQITGFLLVR